MARLSSLVLASIAALAAPAFAATPGFVEDFSAGTGGFGVMGSTVTHVTTGGVGGAADPYISISNAASAQLGSFSTAADLNGNLPADGVTGYSFWLRDTGADNNHEIHVGVGIVFTNFWLSIPGFTPPDGSWQQFSVDITNPSQWVQIIGPGTFQDALAASDRLLFRHDLPPLVQQPNFASGDFGLDRIQVLPAPASVPTISAPGHAALALLIVALAGLAARGRWRARATSAA
jgi:hypothetical protein